MRVVPRDTTVWMGVDLAESVSVTEVQLLRGEIGRWEGVRIIPHSRSCIAEAKVLQDIVNRQLSEYIRATAASPFARAAVLSTSDPYVGVAV